ncbi:MAG TPA: histidine kinase [Myxococcaceae bacterium]|nr:histidine kinase [Myxococcaceae bacterium]
MLASLRRFAGLLALWSIPGLAVGLQTKVWMPEVDWGTHRFFWFYSSWAIIAFLIPALAWVVRRFTLERDGVWRVAAAHAVTLAGFILVNEGWMAVMSRWGGPYYLQKMPAGTVLLAMVKENGFLDAMNYAMCVGVLLALDLRRRLRTQELAGARLHAELARAELEALRGQLHPHFLFNTLNAISMLVRKGESETAVRMITGLDELLRLALATAGQQEVPLRQELDFLERYLCLQQLRFPDRLKIEMHIAPETLEARVPSLVLQPLAENAVRHGIAPSVGGGSVEVAAVREGEQLVLRVRDTGVGLRNGSESSGGVGLRNVRARLQHLYPGEHRFRVANRSEGGVESLMAIPFRSPEVARA